jgi:hypothetical protein
MVLLLLGCGAGSKQEAAPASRVAAVKANPEAAAAAAGKWADVSYPAASAPVVELPAVVPARPNGRVPDFPPAPCVREMPMMDEWQAKFQAEGVAVDLWYLSVDEQEALLTNFLRQRPSMAPGVSLRLKEYGALFPWLTKYQIDPQSGIPIHLLIAPGGKVRYVHISQLREGDYRVLAELME